MDDPVSMPCLSAQFEAIDDQLALEREHAAQLGAQLAGVAGDLARERGHGAQLEAQLAGVAKELAWERDRAEEVSDPSPDEEARAEAAKWLGRGHHAMSRRDLASATEAFERAIRLEPRDGGLWLSLGHALSAAGDAERSTRAFHHCLSLDLDRAAKRRGLSAFTSGLLVGNGYSKALDPGSLEPPLPGLFINTLPKTGSEFILRALCDGLGKHPLAGIVAGLFPNTLLTVGGLDAIRATGGILLTHCAPSTFNRVEVSNRIDRMVVHVRDPRQNLVSWAHYIPTVIRDVDPVQAIHLQLPGGYSDSPFERQMDWYIEHLLPDILAFIVGWTDAPAASDFRTRILYTSQEELAADPDAFFGRVLAFHDIDPGRFIRPPTPRSGHLNYRRGSTDEWRSAMTPTQRERVTAAIPERLFDRFGWPRR